MGRKRGHLALDTKTTVFGKNWTRVDLRIIYSWNTRRNSERVKPGQEILVAFPARRLGWTSRYFFKRITLCLQIGLCVVARGIEMGMSEHVPDHGDIDS